MRWRGFAKKPLAAAVAAIAVGALAAIPGHARAQTPVTVPLSPVYASYLAGGIVTLTGYNSIAVTINGVIPGNNYNVYACSANVGLPSQSGCQLANGLLLANSGGQATGYVTNAIANSAVAEVFVQNVNNTGELYIAVFSGAYPGPGAAASSSYSTSTTVPTCSSGYALVYVNGVPTCTPLSTSSTACTSLVYVNGVPTCAGYGYSSLTYGCGTLAYVNGQLVCSGTGLPYSSYYPYYYPYYYGYYYPYYYGYGTSTSCVPGAGLQPVVVNGMLYYVYC